MTNQRNQTRRLTANETRWAREIWTSKLARELTDWQWAWAFLRRNDDYRKTYRRFQKLPIAIQNSINISADPLDETPVQCLDVLPMPIEATTLGEWRRETEGQCRSFSFAEEFEHEVRFGINRWLDPKTRALSVLSNPFVVTPIVPVTQGGRLVKDSEGVSQLRPRHAPFMWEWQSPFDAIVAFDTALPLKPQLDVAASKLAEIAKQAKEAEGLTNYKQRISPDDLRVLLKILRFGALKITDQQLSTLINKFNAELAEARRVSIRNRSEDGASAPKQPEGDKRSDADANREHVATGDWVKDRRRAAERMRAYGYRFLASL